MGEQIGGGSPAVGARATQQETSKAGPLRRLLDGLVWRVRRRKYARLVHASRLFDEEFYLGQCPGDRAAARDPVAHYLAVGAAAGLEPNPYFDTRFFLERNPDALGSGKNPLVHYLRHSAWEHAPSPLFDPAFYTSRYPDVGGSGLCPLAHFLTVGRAEGRQGLPPAQRSFDLLEWAGHRDPAAARRVLVVEHRMLTPDHDSGSVRMLTILRILRELGLEVVFGADSPGREFTVGEEALRGLGVELLFGIDEITEHLIAEGHTYGTAILCRPEVTRRYLPQVRGYAPWARVVYDTVDLHWLRNAREAELTGSAAARAAAERYRALETLNVRASDATLAITADEREVVRGMVPGARVEVLPNIHECSPSAVPWEQRHGLMFIGGYEHPPNVDAVEWFVAEILPLVRRELPEAVFRVVGSKAPERVRKLAGPGVEVVGYVPDPAPLFHASRVFVAPLRYGAGMKGKIGQSMGYGLPVVTTRIGAEGMGLVDGATALVADEPAAFAQAVVRLHQDELLWSRVARAALGHVQDNYSVEAVRGHVRRLLSPGDGAAVQAPTVEGERR